MTPTLCPYHPDTRHISLSPQLLLLASNRLWTLAVARMYTLAVVRADVRWEQERTVLMCVVSRS
jgi:hypothetical protein